MNRSRPYGEHEFSDSEARRRFKKSHHQKELDMSCPECGSSEFYYWNSNVARKSDYDFCEECNYSRAYMATG